MLEDARKALYSSKPAEAIPLLSRLVESSPQNAVAYQYLAFAFYRTHDLESAKKYSKKAIELDPNLPLPWVILAYLSYIEEKDIEKCSELAYKALQLDPKCPEALACVGTVHLLKGEYQRAAQALEKAVSESPYLWGTWNNLAVAYMYLGKWRKAFKVTFELFKQKPSLHMGMRLLISLMRLREIGVALLASILLAIWLGSPAFLLFLVFYAFLLLLVGIYYFSQKAIKAGITTATRSLLFLLLALWLNSMLR